ncbi:hypothetical protein Dsin_022166 [Dipteronia sinensis]|uniref:Uncharacterized protein n=1 Tax=Dipteronia sinensis TaxID=43782 RepID=A0AAE0A2B6_9ROSI|nr:hypothetical protein Dsin_022166 [Dipteronia sinensis]
MMDRIRLSRLLDHKEDTRKEREGSLSMDHGYSSKDLEGILVKKVEESPELDPTEDGVLEIVEASDSED